MTGSTAEAQTRLTEILDELAEDTGFSEQPYKRGKQATEPLNQGELWHCKQARKNWAALSQSSV